jgi:hypothetical protein
MFTSSFSRHACVAAVLLFAEDTNYARKRIVVTIGLKKLAWTTAVLGQQALLRLPFAHWDLAIKLTRITAQPPLALVRYRVHCCRSRGRR